MGIAGFPFFFASPGFTVGIAARKLTTEIEQREVNEDHGVSLQKYPLRAPLHLSSLAFPLW